MRIDKEIISGKIQKVEYIFESKTEYYKWNAFLIIVGAQAGFVAGIIVSGYL